MIKFYVFLMTLFSGIIPKTCLMVHDAFHFITDTSFMC